MITADQLAACTGATLRSATNWLDPLSSAMDVFAITSPARIVAFLANVGEESYNLVYVREIWGPSPAQIRYEGRKDLGNLRPGDGRKYMGRGLIETTGRANYAATRDGLRHYLPNVPDFEASPELLELPRWAAYSAAWFFAKHGCNELADVGDFDGVCDLINRGHKTEAKGDSNGYPVRLALWTAGKVALNVLST